MQAGAQHALGKSENNGGFFMYDVIILGAGVSGCAVAGNCRAIRGGSACWSGRRTCAAEPPRQTAESCMQGLTPNPVP